MGKIHQLDELLSQKSARAKAKPAGSFAPVSAPAAPISEGEALLWVDVDLIDDNPYQPRLNYPNDAQADMVADLNRDGQLQPALARQMPGRAGRYQLAAGHRRKYAVKNGAYLKNESGEETRIYGNAGSQQPNPREFEGKMLLVVRAEITNREMRRYAYKENKSRLDLAPLENSAFYNRMRDDLTIELRESGQIGRDKEAPWRAVGEELGENFRNVHRIARLSELPEAMQKALTPAGDTPAQLNARHGRALMELHEWPREQRNLFADIKRHGWSGSKAEAVASERKRLLNEKIPTPDSLIDEAVERELDRRERPAAQVQQEEAQVQANRRAMTLTDNLRETNSQSAPAAKTTSATSATSATPAPVAPAPEPREITPERASVVTMPPMMPSTGEVKSPSQRHREAAASGETPQPKIQPRETHLRATLWALGNAIISLQLADGSKTIGWNNVLCDLCDEVSEELRLEHLAEARRK